MRSSGPKKSLKLFAQIADDLQMRISSGEFSPDSFLPTERELQEHYSASRTTVRKALAKLTEDDRIINVPNRGVKVAPQPQRSTLKKIAVIDDISYVLRVLDVRIDRLLRARGYELVRMGSRIYDSIEQAFEDSYNQNFAGVLCWSYRGYPNLERIKRVMKAMPVVMMNHRIDGIESDLVTFDYVQAVYDAVTQLAKQGHQNVALSGYIDMLEITQKRIAGYMKAGFDLNLTPMPGNFLFVHSSACKKSDTRLLEKRLRMADRPDGIVVTGNEFVPEIVEAIQRVGLRIPQDVAIVSIEDDIDLMVEGVGLTSVALHWEDLAKNAVDLLISRIEGNKEPFKTIYCPHELVVRGLCGAPSAEWTAGPGEFEGFAGDVPYPRSQYRYQSGLTALDAEQTDLSQSGEKNK